MTAEATRGHPGDRIGSRPGTTAAVVLSAPVVGAALGLLLPTLTGWALSLPWMPLRGPLNLLDQLAAITPWWVAVLVGVVGGTLVGLSLLDGFTTVTVTDRELVVVTGSERRRWARAQVHEAVLEGRHLSLRDERDVDLVRQSVDGNVPALTDALRRHGWPVRD
jgi:hypothetical protein